MKSPRSSPGNRRDRVAEAHHQFSDLYGSYRLGREITEQQPWPVFDPSPSWSHLSLVSYYMAQSSRNSHLLFPPLNVSSIITQSQLSGWPKLSNPQW